MSIPPYFSCSIFICSIPRNSKAFVTIVSLIWFFSNMYDLVFDQILPYMIKCLSQGLHSLNLGCTLCYFTRLLFWEKKTFATMVALVWYITCVYSLMFYHIHICQHMCYNEMVYLHCECIVVSLRHVSEQTKYRESFTMVSLRSVLSGVIIYVF